ncbi:MAG: hypothetical protein AAF317_12685, partial [Pseudomonadota bacterium]
DKTIAEGQIRIARLIESQEGGTRDVFDRTTEEVTEGLKSSGTKIADELRARVAALDETLESEGASLKSVIAGKVDALGATVRQIEGGLEEQLSAHKKRVTDLVDQRLEAFQLAVNGVQDHSTKTIETLTDRIDRELNTNRTAMEAAFNRRGENLETQNRKLEVDIPRNIDQIDQTVKEMARVLSDNPPPSAEELAERLGVAARELVTPERKALSEMTSRMRKLEEQAQKLITQLDRTSRMNAAFERPSAVESAEERDAGPGLPFTDAPADTAPRPLDWTLVLRALELPDPGAEAARPIQQEVERDRALKRLIVMGREIQDALAEDGLFLPDLTPEHASSTTWMSYASGERGPAMAKELSGISDEVALTLARARLRRDPDFRDLSLRFVSGYQDLLRRAVAEGFQGSHMMELAEAQAGRAFLLLGQLSGAFEPLHGTAEA